MELVASNEALRRRNTRLNPYLLFEGSHKWVSVHGGGELRKEILEPGGPSWTRTTDLALIRGALSPPAKVRV